MLSGALAGHWNACLALQSLDLAEYNFLFALSFTTPTFDSEVAPSFGTLLATVNVALNMLGEVSWVLSGPSTQASVSLPDREPGHIYPAWACLVRDLPSKNLSVSWSYHCYLTFFYLLILFLQLDKKKEPLTQAVGLSTQAEGPRTLK